MKFAVFNRDKFSPCFKIKGTNILDKPISVNRKIAIVIITAKVFGHLSLPFKNLIIGRAIRLNTAAITIYIKTDLIRYKKYRNRREPTTINKALIIPLESVFAFIGYFFISTTAPLEGVHIFKFAGILKVSSFESSVTSIAFSTMIVLHSIFFLLTKIHLT